MPEAPANPLAGPTGRRGGWDSGDRTAVARESCPWHRQARRTAVPRPAAVAATARAQPGSPTPKMAATSQPHSSGLRPPKVVATPPVRPEPPDRAVWRARRPARRPTPPQRSTQARVRGRRRCRSLQISSEYGTDTDVGPPSIDYAAAESWDTAARRHHHGAAWPSLRHICLARCPRRSCAHHPAWMLESQRRQRESYCDSSVPGDGWDQWRDSSAVR